MFISHIFGALFLVCQDENIYELLKIQSINARQNAHNSINLCTIKNLESEST